MKVVTFGEIMLRLASPDYQRLQQCNTFEIGFAGAEANVAVSLANYGVQTDYVTVLPHNPMADHCISALRGHGVGVQHIQRAGNRIGVLYLETGSNFRPSRVVYDRAYSAIAEVVCGSIDWESVLNGVDWFHFTGITPALSEQAATECLNAVLTARRLGITISCDLNYRKNLWQYGKSAADVMPALVEHCDVILANEEDCEKVFGIKPLGIDVENVGGSLQASAFLSVCEQMMQRFPRCRKIAMTLRGAVNANHNYWKGILYDGDKLHVSREYSITHIVDRVGGGDSFMGGLIYGLMNLDSDKEALEFAVAASALKHTIQGDFNEVSLSEVKALMQGDTSGRVKR